MGIAMKSCTLVMCVLVDLVDLDLADPSSHKFGCLKAGVITQKISILRPHCLALGTIFAL